MTDATETPPSARSEVPRPVVLCVIDGLGAADAGAGNAFHLARTPELDALAATGASTRIAAAGDALGLKPGARGHCESGHLALGAGRVVTSASVRVDEAIRARKLGRNEVIDQTFRIADYDQCALHLVGLLSEGGVHANVRHLYELLELADFHQVPVVVHAILDGRDSPPRSAAGYLQALETFLDGKNAIIGTVSGRHYAMDCDGRWDRTYQVFHAMVRDKVLGPAAPRAETPLDVLYQAYAQKLGDAHVVPTRIGDYQGFRGDFLCDFASQKPVWEWTGEEVGLALNHRDDGLRQLTAMLTRQELPEEIALDLLMDRNNPMRGFREHCFATLTEYDEGMQVPVAFPRERVADSLGEVLARAGKRQVRCGETEKATQVTRWFSGGHEGPFEGETRLLVPSNRAVDNYADKPAMRADKVAARAVEAITSGNADFVLVNFANPDVVGSLGKLDATVAAIEAVDAAVGRLARAVREAGGALLVTSDHGNAEVMLGADGKAHPMTTANLVPLLYLEASGRDVKLRDGGSLCDVAPTLLQRMGLPVPEAMTGRSLLIDDG